MSGFDAGAAVAKYTIDYGQAREAGAALHSIYAGLRQDSAALGTASRQVETGFTSQSAAARKALADFERLDRQYTAIRDSEIRAARASGDHAKALELIDVQLKAAIPGTTRYNTLLAQQATVTRQAAQAQGGGDGLSGSLLGVAGSLVVAAGGFTLVTRAVQSFADAFDFKVKLDATNLSISNQLRGVRDLGQTFGEARQFGERYKITQAETSEILRNSIGVLRSSTSSVAELESVLIRLQSRDPSKPISEAARALRELNTGDVTTIKEIFNIGAADALRMKNEIAKGGDAVQVLSAFLTSAGNGMEVLDQRTQGIVGKLNDATVQAEKFQLALAGKAGGPGAVLLDFKTNLFKEFTAILSGDFSEIEARNRKNELAQLAYNDAIAQGKNDAEAYAVAQGILNGTTKTVDDLTLEAVNALRQRVLASGPAITGMQQEISGAIAAGNAARQHADALGAQTVKTLQANAEAEKQRRVMALIAQQSGLVQKGFITQAQGVAVLRGELGSAADEALRLQAELGRAAAVSAQKDAPTTSAERSLLAKANAGQGDASERLKKEKAFRDAQKQFQQDLLRFDSPAAQLAAKRRELAGIAADDPKRFTVQLDIRRLQEQIEAERLRTAKSHTSELNKQLGLNESIYDSQQKQLDAQLKGQELAIRNRQE